MLSAIMSDCVEQLYNVMQLKLCCRSRSLEVGHPNNELIASTLTDTNVMTLSCLSISKRFPNIYDYQCFEGPPPGSCVD